MVMLQFYFYKRQVSFNLLTKFACLCFVLFFCQFFFIQEVLAETRVFTLSKAIDTALTNAPNVLAKLAELKGAESAAKAAKGSLLPQINAYANYSRLSDPVAVVPIKGFGRNPPYFSKDIYKMGINIYVPIYQGGKLRANFKKAQFNKKAQEYGLKAFKETLAAQVSTTFYEIIYLKALLEAKNITYKALEAQYENAKAAYRVGKIAQLDLMELETQLSSQHQKIVNTQQAIIRAGQQFMFLLGLSPTSEFQLKGSLDANNFIADFNPHDFQNQVYLETIIDKRPDIVSAKHQVRAAQEGVKAAKALHMPNVALIGDYGRHAGSGFEGNEEVWSAGVNLNLNIFSGGTISAKVSQAQAKLLAAEQQLRQRKSEAITQISMALSSLKEAEARIQLANKVQDTAEEAFRIEKLKYEKGAGTITDVLKAQATWDETKASLVKALFDKTKALTDLYLYTGTLLNHLEKIHSANFENRGE